MRNKIIIKKFLLLTSFFLTSSCLCTNQPKPIPQQQIQEITRKLDALFFKGNCPNNITGKYIKLKDFGGMFDTSTNSITLSSNYLTNKTRTERPLYEHKNKEELLTHEICHLCLYSLTKGNSNKKEFRFLDEGLAEIVGRQIAEPTELEQYKKKSIQTTKEKIKNEGVSLEKIQQWTVYFGDPKIKALDWSAYMVGSSFVFFILDNYQKDKLYDFFVSISKTRNLEKSIFETFSKNGSDFEKEWLRYVHVYVP